MLPGDPSAGSVLDVGLEVRERPGRKAAGTIDEDGALTRRAGTGAADGVVARVLASDERVADRLEAAGAPAGLIVTVASGRVSGLFAQFGYGPK